MMQKIKALAMLWLVVLCVGCTSLGLVPANSLEQQLAYAYGNVASLRTSAAQALQAGTITPTQAEQVLDLTDKARAALDAGEQILTTAPQNTTGVQQDLAIAIEAIQAVQAMLPAPTAVAK